MKVVAYLAGVPSPHKSPHKIEVLEKFIRGVNVTGDQGIAHKGMDIISSDVAVIQGWVHESSPNTPHLTLRKKVAEVQKIHRGRTIIIDSNLFNYKDKNHPIHYSRYSLDGVFPTTGNYFWDNPDPNRWKQISRDLGITLQPWRHSGNHILICTQRNGGWSMRGLSVVDWLNQVLNSLRQYTDRPIIVRGHPGDRAAKKYLGSVRQKFLHISNNESILDDFKNAHAVVTYNSTPAVAASIEGIPAFVTDPEPKISQAYDVANFNLSKIETPEYKDRQNWIEKLAMCHWNYGELDSGAAWKHMRNFL